MPKPFSTGSGKPVLNRIAPGSGNALRPRIEPRLPPRTGVKAAANLKKRAEHATQTPALGDETSDLMLRLERVVRKNQKLKARLATQRGRLDRKYALNR